MKFTIVTAVLLGLVLTPALGVDTAAKNVQQVFPGQDDSKNPQLNQKTTIIVGTQILTINRQWRVATIEKKTTVGSWKTIWNYDMGFIVTRVPSERVCYISVMDRKEMPRFDALPRLAEQNRAQGRPEKEITYVVKRPVRDLQSYGEDVFTMCRGLTTYVTYEVHGPQNTVNQGSCTRLDVLHLLDLIYCRPNIKT